MKILTVGAGISGAATACGLAKDGHDVHIIDASPDPYRGGYQLVFDPVSLRLLTRLGVRDPIMWLSDPAPKIAIRTRRTTLVTLDTDGYRLARRGPAARAVADHVARTVPIRYGIGLDAIEQRPDEIVAHLTDGTAHSYDLIVGADGLRSTVRALALGSDFDLVYDNGRTHVWMEVPGVLPGPARAASITGPTGTVQVFPYPGNQESVILGTLRTGVGRRSPRDLGRQIAALLGQAGPDVAAIAAEAFVVPEDRIYTTRFSQVRAPQWHAARVVLAGDAAHCIDPISGAGAHAALLGATILPEELRRTPHDQEGAFRRYRRRTNRFVHAAQLSTAGLIETVTASGPWERARGAGTIIHSLAALRPSRIPAHPSPEIRSLA